MPFQSEKQRKYLWANEPEIARDWTDKYGSRVKKDNGGIMDAWGKHATATETMKLMNQPDYHQKAGYNFMQNFPNTPNWLANTLATGYQYGSEGFKALKGGTDFSDAMARAKEESRLNKLGIQGSGFDMGEYENFMQNYNTANDISSLPRSSGIWNAIKNEFGGSAEAAEVPIKKNNMILPRRKPGLPPTWSMTDDLEAQNIRPTFDSSDEEQDYYNQISNKIGKMPTIKDPNIFQRFRNRFYKPAAGAVNYGGKTYSPAQLNSMNALGGHYSEPARQQRRTDARRTNILNRAAKGKAVGNVNALLGKHGYQSTPGGGLQFTGQHEGSSTAGAGYSRSDSGWSSSPFRRGGLASLWQRQYRF